MEMFGFCFIAQNKAAIKMKFSNNCKRVRYILIEENINLNNKQDPDVDLRRDFISCREQVNSSLTQTNLSH